MRTTDKYVLFWNGIYSNWYYSPFEVEGVSYSCSEQFMMHQKALLFGDEKAAFKIMNSNDPAFIKAVGREVKGFVYEEWKEARWDVMFKGCYEKFRQNPELQEQLLATGDRTIVEASPSDKIWGIGLGENNPKAEDESTWEGLNLLGYVLTEVRETIKCQLIDKHNN
jgi:ribA/ribD-fused uncharacterized protein